MSKKIHAERIIKLNINQSIDMQNFFIRELMKIWNKVILIFSMSGCLRVIINYEMNHALIFT
jgi:hypothetical protein